MKAETKFLVLQFEKMNNTIMIYELDSETKEDAEEEMEDLKTNTSIDMLLTRHEFLQLKTQVNKI